MTGSKKTCALCGYSKYKGALHNHHIDENHDNDTPSNIQVLCANCHAEVHYGIIKEAKRAKRLLRYTRSDILKAFTNYPEGLMLGRIQSDVGCSEMTARNLLKPMVDSGEVIRTNISQSETKPYYLYTLKK
jgi:hypothetical protein